MRKVLISFLLTTTLASCDYFNDTRICNQTGKEITLKITFDKDEVNGWSGGMLAKNLTKTFKNFGDNLTPFNIDTINYVATYTIKPDTCGSIEGGNKRRPNFHFFKELEVISGDDTLRLRTKEEMRKAFDADREDPKYFFDLLIQKGVKNASR